jgi:hypothetical protein
VRRFVPAFRASCFASVLCIASSLAAEGISRSSTTTAGFVGMATLGPLDEPVAVSSFEEFVAIFGAFDPGLTSPYLAPSVAGFFANGGESCVVVRTLSDEPDELIGSGARRSGIAVFELVDGIGMLCVPGVTDRRVARELIAHCESHGDRIAILDAEFDASIDAVIAQRLDLVSDGGFAALYYPWVIVDPFALGIPDPALTRVPPSGFVAGVWARVERELGVWESPVGDLLAVAGVERSLTSPQVDTLVSSSVNPIRALPGDRTTVWGARTTSNDPDQRHLGPRRLSISIAAAVRTGTEWAVFEPNDDVLWARLRACVEDFLVSWWQEGALLGPTSDQAFFVRVDRSTMTEADIAAGRTIILFGLAPVRPDEFVLVRVVHTRSTGESFIRGDANGDGEVDISDPVRVLTVLFLGGAEISCPDAADSADEGAVTISSAVRILDFLFQGSAAPPPPFPACGPDPSPDELDGCEATPDACP